MNRGAVAAVINDDHEVLLVRALTHSNFTNYWSLPGGVVETGETLQEGAIREVLEETGVHCKIVVLLGKTDNTSSDIQVSTFQAVYISGGLTLQESEIADARWFSIQDALKVPLAFNIKDMLISVERNLKSR